MARYEFIDANKATRNSDGTPRYTIRAMCRWLEVSVSGFYEWASRPASATACRRERLKTLITRACVAHDGRCGYRRVHVQLSRWGVACSPELVRVLMRELDLVACQPRRSRKATTRQAAKTAPIPDLVRRDFTADAPGAKLVGDITYIPTWQGWVYLATVLDCCTKKVVGYAMAEHTCEPSWSSTPWPWRSVMAISAAGRRFSIRIAGLNTCRPSLPSSRARLGLFGRSDGLVSAMTMRGPSRSMRP
mgnify:CR=1 FL=1